MIWLLIFFSIMMFSCKDYFYLTQLFSLSSSELLMVSISPLSYFLISYFLFNKLGYLESLGYSWLMGLSIFFTSICFMVSNSLVFLIFLEMVMIPICTLIFWHSKDSDKISSVFFMFFLNLLGSLPFILFSLNFLGLSFYFSCSSYFYSLSKIFSPLFYLFFLLILLCKVPFFFLHYWLTKAHVSSSGACSMILASLMLKLGTYGLVKFNLIFRGMSLFLLNFVVYLSLMGMIFFLLVMYRSSDLKYIIAGSSVLHMSLIVPLSISFGYLEYFGSLFMMVSHGVVSYYLFLLVSILYETTHSRSVEFSSSLESISKTLVLLIFVCLFLNLGLPPFMGFFSELLFCSFFSIFDFYLLVILLFSMLMSVAYLLYVVSKFYFGKTSDLVTLSGSALDLSIKSYTFLSALFLLPFLS
uniref:NADH-ubiquinone oxidoreductase chain 4 n=1 Tax=Epitrimerus sabinae TaxID=1452570 RepID=A0A0U2J711_9ACAR|nr:NADH dehydrogenase subunit 4 [Epitrimerus sabinae]ALK03790.1 NADH dehydrogenase subunit 4 [Epitrimerus sabinae]